MQRKLPLICALLCLLALAAGAQAQTSSTADTRIEVVVLLAAPSLAEATGTEEQANARITAEQRRFTHALARAVPTASVRWRYRLVANGLAVVVPRDSVDRVRRLASVREVIAGVGYEAQVNTSPQEIGAPALWGPGLENAGEGMKIGIIDDGVDQRHRFFDPASYRMPAGYPKGVKAYTTAKVIVARAFPPPGATWKNAGKPFDPIDSDHGTHVAGIAAGNSGTLAEGKRISGVAPRAYIGNYKALTVPTDSGVGLDGNAAEIVAAIEAAVADGMDVINLSIGEPEVEPSRDIVARALDAAAALGVVPVVAAGNDFGEFGRGSVSSPGSSDRAITVAAVGSNGDRARAVADFSAAGPTTLSLRLKPDVSAPGVGILSSVPGGWESMSGTSMASPHVAGAAALLLQRHPGWSVAQVKAALIGTAAPDTVTGEPAQTATPARAGGGFVDLPRANRPLVLADPASVSFGLVRPGATPTATVALADAGDGAGTWSVSVVSALRPPGAQLVVAPTVEVPGVLALTVDVPVTTPEGDMSGWITLTRGDQVRRVPFWLRVTRPALAGATVTLLRREGSFAGNTRGHPALVSTYRYPEVRVDAGITRVLDGPEQVFRVRLSQPAANFGAVVTSRAKGVRVEPRVVVAGDENRLTGYAALPLNLNPYLAQFGQPVLAAGAVRPLAGSYDIVFDSAGSADAGAFTFRYWVNDVRPPAASLLTPRVRRGQALRVRVSDAGAGIDPSTVVATLDGELGKSRLRDGIVSIATGDLRTGRHSLRLQLSDYQESRNMENVSPILPNTRVLRAVIVVT